MILEALPLFAAPALALGGPLVLAGLFFAWGIIFMGRAFNDALFGILKVVLKWSGAGLIFRAGGWFLSKVGVDAPDPLSLAHQWIADKLGAAADGVGGAIAYSWNILSGIVTDLGWTIWNLGTAVDRLRAFVTDIEHLAKLVVGTSAFALAVKALRSNVTKVVHDTTTIVKQIAQPIASPVGAAVKVVTRVDRVALRRFEAWTRGRLNVLEAAIAAAAGAVAPWPGAAIGDLRDALNRVGKRLRTLERATVGTVGVAAIATLLARLGMTWARCDRVKQAGRGVCRMDTDALDALLAGTTVIVGSLSIRAFARELSDGMDEATGLLTGFVREAPKG